jgi:hypothetical protein
MEPPDDVKKNKKSVCKLFFSLFHHGPLHTTTPLNFQNFFSSTEHFRPKQKKEGAQDTAPGPQVIEGYFFLEIKNGKGDKHQEGYHFLDNFEVSHGHHRMTDTIGRNLKQILEKRDTPADKGRHYPRPV